MNSLSKLNTGGERILEHVSQALKDEDGVRAESLLACLGGLAGYACQIYVRQAAAMPRADAASFALTRVEAGGRHLCRPYGLRQEPDDAPDRPAPA